MTDLAKRERAARRAQRPHAGIFKRPKERADAAAVALREDVRIMRFLAVGGGRARDHAGVHGSEDGGGGEAFVQERRDEAFERLKQDGF